ncbi:MAG: carboxymuconolactone decarboxylase family protein [Coriobacteriaceae bacterium]
MAGKKNGVTAREMAAILTHVAFYAGWPSAWAAFRVVLKVYADDPLDLKTRGPRRHLRPGRPQRRLRAVLRASPT